MAPDNRKGQPPGRGRSAAPDTPDTHHAKAPPLPEAPDATAEPTAPTPGTGAPDAGAGGHPDESESGRLRREVDAARKALEAKEAELARVEAQRQADEAAAKMVAAYAAEVPALKAMEQELRQYQTAETSFVNEILPPSARAAIADVHKGPEQEVATLAAKVAQEEKDAAEARRALGEARQAAADAKAAAEALKRPAVSIRDRIRAAEAVRAEAMKASDSGRYALAYWLIMPGGKLERAIAAEPAILEPDKLGPAIKTAGTAQQAADDRVASLTKQVETIEATLQTDRTKLADLQRGLDAKILAELSKLNPQTAAAA